MSDLLDLLGDWEDSPEWEPIVNRWDQPDLARLVGAFVLCRDCGAKANYNQGGAGGEGTYMVCDPCAQLDACTTRKHDCGPEWHVSHWGEVHRADEHESLARAQAKRRAAYRHRVAKLEVQA